ncbi:MAG: DUF6431 domain-containing protein [Lachnospiraceae bacterium]|nr:DUF6431 domain-containing protein [Lachnospiraceae bacterium]
MIISEYTLCYKPQFHAFQVVNCGFLPCCPNCGCELRYRDLRKRIRRREGGVKERLIIRRLRCKGCRTYHNELPDCLVPHKHYDAETISGVLDGVIKPTDADSEDYPCLQTMLRWLNWLNFNLSLMEESLRRASRSVLYTGKDILSSGRTVLDTVRSSFPDWLERVLRVIYNSGRCLLPLY